MIRRGMVLLLVLIPCVLITRVGSPAALHLEEPPVPTTSAAADPRLPEHFTLRTARLPNGEERAYALFIPPEYDRAADRLWPVIVFLHSSGQVGHDPLRTTTMGLPEVIRARPDRFPFITIMPQAQTMWFRGDDALAVFAALEDVHRHFHTDRDRVYLTGISMGGYATWELAMLHPDLFAAIVPICGEAAPDYVSNLREVPVWAFHGRKDSFVPVAGSRDPINALRELGAQPEYTEYPTLGHRCWHVAYASDRLYDWMLAHRRRPAPGVIDYKFPGGTARVWWLSVEGDPGAKPPAHIRAGIDGQRVSITSTGVVAWVVSGEQAPLKRGSKVDITWNDSPPQTTTFEGVLAASMKRPASEPAP